MNGRATSPPTIVRGAHATACERSNPAGAFRVFFDRNVRACAYVATIGLTGAELTEQPGFITTVGAAASADAIFVTTHDIAGTPADRSFHLQVSPAIRLLLRLPRRRNQQPGEEASIRFGRGRC